MKKSILTALLILALVGIPNNTHASKDRSFYAGKTVTVVVAAGPGGGHSIHTLLVMPFLKKHTPGNPTYVIKNMHGSGGRKAAVYMEKFAPKDGTVITINLSGFALGARLNKNKKYDYHPEKFHPLGGGDINIRVFSVMKKTGVRTLEQARKVSVNMGASSARSPTSMTVKLVNAIFGTKFSIITGYRGSSDIYLAMERGEVDGIASGWAAIASRFSQQKITPLAILAMNKDPDPRLRDVPLLIDLVKNKSDRAIILFFARSSILGRAWMAPPGVPKERLEVLRKAFWSALNDPELLKVAKRRGWQHRPVHWKTIQQALVQTMNVSDAVVTRTKKILGRK